LWHDGGVAVKGLSQGERAAWVRLASVLELLPGVLDTQLRRDAGLMHFEYFVLAMLSEAPKRTLRMSALAAQTNSTPARLSHVVTRLEDRGLAQRFPCPEDARATNGEGAAAGEDEKDEREDGLRLLHPAPTDRRHPDDQRRRTRGPVLLSTPD
jgi:hypothetical protein